MKKTKIYLLLFLAVISLSAVGQQVNINVNSIPASIEQNKEGYLVVNICNVDADPIAVPANKLRPLISVPGNVEITGVTDINGNPLSGFTIQSLTTGAGNSIRLLATQPLPNFECFDFHITIKGINVGANDVVTATLGFQGPPPINDNPADNNSLTGIAVTVPLPVTLVSFNVAREGKTASLNWATTQETNSDRFEIEHSLNGKNWSKIGIVASHGESASLKNYSFTDSEPEDGENLYRLRMVDKDQTFAYSRIQGVKFEGVGKDLSVYPNPAADLLYIRDAANVGKISITDLKGTTVYQSNGLQHGEVSVSNLLAGVYVVKIVRKNGKETVQKIVVSR